MDHTFQTDKKLVHLVRSMENAFAFVREREGIEDKVTGLQQSIEGLLKQTVECCVFICKYTRQRFISTSVHSTSVRPQINSAAQSEWLTSGRVRK